MPFQMERDVCVERDAVPDGTGCVWNVCGPRSSVAGAGIYKGWVFVVWGFSFFLFSGYICLCGVFYICLLYSVLKWIISILDYICVYIVKTVNTVSYCE